jgi:hypothetical protein
MSLRFRHRSGSIEAGRQPPVEPGPTDDEDDGIMADITLTAAFSTVPAPEQEAIKRLLTETIQQIAADDGTFTRAKIVFTESDERCGLTAELDGVKREGVPLAIDIEQLEDAQSAAGARAQLRESLRLYFRRVMGRA